MKNDLCYPLANLSICPPDYFLHTDGLCYPKVKKTCPADQSTTATTTSNTITTTPIPNQIRQMTCPLGSIIYENKCRKIICTLGEYYRGSCNRPICPPGLVWRGKQCQKPGFITTVIEIDNTFVNQRNQKQYVLETSDHNEIINHVGNVIPKTNSSNTDLIKQYPPKAELNLTTARIFKTSNSKSNGTCCQVISPRICKKYAKWHCFHRKHTVCDERVCMVPLLYLEAPEIKYESPILVMPPEPQLDSCKNRNCSNIEEGKTRQHFFVTTDFSKTTMHFLDIADCSGCANHIADNCHPYCYSYSCSNGACTFLKLKSFCSFYFGQRGCLPNDGCVWSWCTNST